MGTIMDVSVSGVAVEGNLPRIPIGADVVVGSRKASAVRALPHGMAFKFDEPIPADLLDAEIVL